MQPMPLKIFLVYTGKECKLKCKAFLKMANILAVVRMMMISIL